MISRHAHKLFLSLGHFLGCHQRADRSFFIHGKQFPICARCTGVFIGECIATGSVRLFSPSLLLLAFFCGVMFLDWFIQYIGVKESTNVRRLVTGVLGGYAYLTLVLKGLLFLRDFVSSIV